jgi:hypothetical protein
MRNTVSKKHSWRIFSNGAQRRGDIELEKQLIFIAWKGKVTWTILEWRREDKQHCKLEFQILVIV